MMARIGALALAGLAGTLLAAAPAMAGSDDGDEPLARFEDPICPGVAGIEVEQAEAIVGRIRQNLETFGRRLAPPERCKANLIVAIVDNGQAYVQRMDRDSPWVLSQLSAAERAQLLADSGPAHAVLRIVPRSRDGMRVARHDDLVNVPQSYMWMAHSKIYTATRNDIASALVLLDKDAAQQMTLAQIADYGTLRALTRTLPQTPEARAKSILSMFDPGAVRPGGLTEFDKAFLGNLYSGQPNIPGSTRELALEQATGTDIFKQ